MIADPCLGPPPPDLGAPLLFRFFIFAMADLVYYEEVLQHANARTTFLHFCNAQCHEEIKINRGKVA